MLTLTTRRISRIGASELRIESRKIQHSLSVAMGLASSIRLGRLVHCLRWMVASKSKATIVRYFTVHSVRSFAVLFLLLSWDGIWDRKVWTVSRMVW